MFQVHSIRIATVVALGVLLVLSGTAPAGQALKEAAASELEVRVLEAQQVPAVRGERTEVLYRMEVISVLRSASPVTPGDTITVRSYVLSQEALDRGIVGPQVLASGWLGIAYLNPDPEAGGPEAGRRFAIAANGASFEDVPPGPPSLRWTEDVEVRTE